MSSAIDNIRRLRTTVGIILFSCLIVIIRMFYLQVIRHDHYVSLANQAHFAKFEIPAERGEIFVKDGEEIVPLVLNQRKFRLYADPRFIEKNAEVADALSEITKGDKKKYKQQLERDDTAYVILEKILDKGQAEKIRKLNFKGVGLQEYPVREYPEGSLAAQTLGFVNDDGDGRYGVEQSMNETLAGIPGQLSGAVDVRGIPIATAENIEIQPKNGKSVVLTIDRNVQAAAEKALADSIREVRAIGGSIIVMDARTGDIKAMATLPTYEPGKFRLVDDISVYNNPVVNLTYEPGSVIKAFTMAAGLESNSVRPETTFTDTSRYEIDNFTIKNSTIRDVATRDMREVMKLSLNTGSIFVLEQLGGGGEINRKGKKALYDFFTDNLLLQEPSEIEQTGEVKGTIDPPEKVSDVRYANMTFGQGLKLSMVRMASSYAALVNGGNIPKARLVEGVVTDDGVYEKSEPTYEKSSVIRPDVSQTLVDMMRPVVEDGSARRAKRDGYIIGGKTGTAQKFDPKIGGYSPDKVISSFFGFTGNSTERYVVVTRINEPVVLLPGAPPAAIAFASISDWIINYYGIAPNK